MRQGSRRTHAYHASSHVLLVQMCSANAHLAKGKCTWGQAERARQRGQVTEAGSGGPPGPAEALGEGGRLGVGGDEEVLLPRYHQHALQHLRSHRGVLSMLPSVCI
jgi:hypothetical protein